MNQNIESIKAKLRNYSKNHKRIHTFTLIRFFQERLLYRLSQSTYKNSFLLKGGALIYSIKKEESRPTLDIDLLGKDIEFNQQKIKEIFEDICSLKFEDGVEFDIEAIETDEIQKEGHYSGIRVKIPAVLGKITQKMQIDIGYGDIVYPGPVEMEYPTMIKMESPKILAYSIESMIAEKFYAMIDLAEYNSRMKDFYDIYTILEMDIHKNSNLLTAIKSTFNNRGFELEKNHSVFTEEFYRNKQRNMQWKNFLKKNGLDEDIEFSDVMKMIKERLEPIYLDL